MSPNPKDLLGDAAEEKAPPASSSKRGPGRPTKSSKRDELNAKLRDSIAEIARWVRERDPELGDILLDDGPKMADLFARLATHPKAPDPAVVLVNLLATVLEPVRAFGRTLRVLVVRAVERRRARAAELVELEPEPAGDVFPEPIYAEPEPEPATPARFRADYVDDAGDV